MWHTHGPNDRSKFILSFRMTGSHRMTNEDRCGTCVSLNCNKVWIKLWAAGGRGGGCSCLGLVNKLTSQREMLIDGKRWVHQQHLFWMPVRVRVKIRSFLISHFILSLLLFLTNFFFRVLFVHIRRWWRCCVFNWPSTKAEERKKLIKTHSHYHANKCRAGERDDQARLIYCQWSAKGVAAGSFLNLSFFGLDRWLRSHL